MIKIEKEKICTNIQDNFFIDVYCRLLLLSLLFEPLLIHWQRINIKIKLDIHTGGCSPGVLTSWLSIRLPKSLVECCLIGRLAGCRALASILATLAMHKITVIKQCLSVCLLNYLYVCWCPHLIHSQTCTYKPIQIYIHTCISSNLCHFDWQFFVYWLLQWFGFFQFAYLLLLLLAVLLCCIRFIDCYLLSLFMPLCDFLHI